MRDMRPYNLQTQAGATLIVGLIMLLLMNIVALAAIRGSSLQEQMASNMRDRHIAFGAAEAALREGESFLALGPTAVQPLIGTRQGFYPSFERPSNQYWLGMGADPFNWGLAAEYDAIDNVSAPPRYVVEEVTFIEPGLFGGAADWASLQNMEPEIMYRVTARATGGNENTVAVLQTTYK